MFVGSAQACAVKIRQEGRRIGFKNERQLVADCLSMQLHMQATEASSEPQQQQMDKAVARAEVTAAFSVALRIADGIGGGTAEGASRRLVQLVAQTITDGVHLEETIKMIEAWPESVKVRGENGDLPVQLACENKAPAEVIGQPACCKIELAGG